MSSSTKHFVCPRTFYSKWCIFVKSLIIINSHNDIKLSSLTINSRSLYAVAVYSYWITTTFGNLHDELFHSTQFFYSNTNSFHTNKTLITSIILSSTNITFHLLSFVDSPVGILIKFLLINKENCFL